MFAHAGLHAPDKHMHHYNATLQRLLLDDVDITTTANHGISEGFTNTHDSLLLSDNQYV